MTPVRFHVGTMADADDVTLETGCIIAGHNGQYIPDELARFAEDLGWVADDPTCDPRIIRVFAERMGRNAGGLWDMHSETSDEILMWLNDRVEDGFMFDFDDGEVCLYDMETWTEGR